MIRKPKNYWVDFSNVEAELRPICEELGRFPSTKELTARGKSSLSRYGIGKHGGVATVAEILGYPTYDHAINRQMAGYWTFDKTVSEFHAFIKRHACLSLPRKLMLLDAGRSDLNRALQKHGRDKVSADPRISGLKLERSKRVSKWTEESVLDTLRKFVNEHGFFPSGNDMNAYGLAGLRGAVNRLGGSTKYWRLLGRPIYKRRRIIDPNKLEDKEGVVTAYKKLMAELGHAPSYTDFERLDVSWLGRAIVKFFGSIEGVMDELDIDPAEFGLLKTRDGHLVRSMNEALVDNILSYLGVEHKTEGLIDEDSDRQFSFDFAVTNLAGEQVLVELWGYYKKDNPGALSDVISTYLERKKEKVKFYKARGLKLLELEGERFNGTLQSIFLYVADLLFSNGIIETRFTSVPASAVEFLAYELFDANHVLEEIRALSEKAGYLPSYHELTKMGETPLGDRIMKLGGFPLIREKYGFSEPPVDKKWTAEHMLAEFRPYIEKYSRLPTQSELKNEGRLDLHGALQRYGGIRKFARDQSLTIAGKMTTSTDFNNLEAIRVALTPMLTSDGKIPPLNEIQTKGPSGLHKAIDTLGGRIELAISLGIELSYPPYRDRKYAEWVVRKIVSEIGHLPPNKRLQELGYDSLAQRINNHYGGFVAFAKELGVEYRAERKSYSPEQIKTLLRSLSDELGCCPTTNDFIERNLKNELNYIYRKMGGFNKVRRDLGLM